MARTTVDIDTPILRDLKRLQKQEGKSLGRLISDLLAEALARRRSAKRQPSSFGWVSRPMHARIDVSDRETLYAALEAEGKTSGRG
ncbi:MAG: antitoxin [Candidatus Rokuibacteriota bacterium]